MAEEKEQNEEATGEETTEKKPGKVLPILLALLTASGGGALGMTFLGPAIAPSLAARAENSGGGHGGGGHGAGAVETFHLLENLVVNPHESEGTRYLLVSIAIEPHELSMVETLAGMDVSFRHILLTTLGSKTVAELTDISLRPTLVDQLLTSLETVAGKGTIHRIYLPQYVIQ